jgi:hypothetical protein
MQQTSQKSIASLQINQAHDLFHCTNFHVRCCAYILNILVQYGFTLLHMAIDKTHDLLGYIDYSPSRFESFNAIATIPGLVDTSS